MYVISRGFLSSSDFEKENLVLIRNVSTILQLVDVGAGLQQRNTGEAHGQNVKFPIGPVQPEKWSSSKGRPHFPELFQLDRTDPFSFEPTFLDILFEWNAPYRSKAGAHSQYPNFTEMCAKWGES